MTVQQVLLRAYAGKLTWIEAAEILGYSPRHLRRLRKAHEEYGFHGLFDKRRGRLSPRRMPIEIVEIVQRLYQERYHDFNVKHFHEKLVEKHGLTVSYTWTKNLLQESGIVAKESPRKKHRKKRERRPLPGMMLHIDGSDHQWFRDETRYDLIVILDDATSDIYYARLVLEESTATVMAGLRQVVENKGVFCQLYTDRASHFFKTPKAGEPVDKQSLTQVGRAMRDLGVQLIPAYSPQARGRSERSFRTWQGRLPQELRIRGIETVDQANRFLEEEYIDEFNRRFAVNPKIGQSAFVPCMRLDLDRVFSIQSERTVNRDNTVRFKNLVLQIDKQSWRGSMAGTKVIVYQHLDQTLTIGLGAHEVGRYSETGELIQPEAKKMAAAAGKKVNSPSYPSQQTGHMMC
ncbi:MAG: ISNCY family transposase [Acidobacteriota bacterium]|nr:ISNCY family transposase [Acidobacteriota bacterium]MDH3529521.1 ISNCY family transposase [Acidobacteriota bacterium]